jgi:hypothetical protein
LKGKLVHLNEEQATAFVNYMIDESKLLKAVRVVRMAKPTKTIAKLFAGGRFLQPGKSGIALDKAKYQQATTETIELNSKLVRGAFFITDEEMQDNIEGDGFNENFIRLIARKVANELEEIGVYARKIATDSPLSTLDMFDGFKFRLLQDGNVIDANLLANRTIEKAKFAKLMKALETKYRTNIKFMVPSDVMIDYGLLFDTVADSNVRNELKSNILQKPLIEIPLMRVDEPVVTGTATDVDGAVTANGTVNQVTLTSGAIVTVGDGIVFNYGQSDEKAYTVTAKATNLITLDRPLEYSLADTDTAQKCTFDGSDVILGDPQNFIYGIQTGDGAITFEIERVASLGYTYHYKSRLDFQVENPMAAALLTGLKVA